MYLSLPPPPPPPPLFFLRCFNPDEHLRYSADELLDHQFIAPFVLNVINPINITKCKLQATPITTPTL